MKFANDYLLLIICMM